MPRDGDDDMGITLRLRGHWERYAIFQYFWVIAVLPKALQLVALGVLMCLAVLRSDRKLRPDRFVLLQGLCLLIYALSIVVNAILGQHAMSRVFAAVNTWAINLVALALYAFYRNMELDYRRIGKYSLINLLILIGLWLAFEITDGAKIMFWGRKLSDDDWINGLLDMRFMGFLDYSNLVIFCILFFYPLALRYLSQRPLLCLGLTLLLFPVVSATNSRTGLVLVAVLLLAYVLFVLQKIFFRIYRKYRPHTVLLCCALVLVVGIAAFDMAVGILQKFISLRAGSNSMRTFIYTESLTQMLTRSPVIGIGIKDLLAFQADGYAMQYYALGSHSTYLGMFYKIGLLGGILYLLSLIAVFVPILKSRDKDNHMLMLKVCVLGAALMMLLEDIDGANWSICLFYLLLAFLRNPRWDEPKTNEIKGK